MSESQKHKTLINLLVDRAKKLISPDLHSLLCVDNSLGISLPPLLEHARPDLYYCYEKLLIIGEAKTSKDISNSHSMLQFETYIEECNNFVGDKYLIIAVPWKEKALVSNLISKKMKEKRANFKFEIIDELT